MAGDARKQAEIDYPSAVGDEGRAWIRTKPFGNTPRESARLLIDFGYVLQLLELQPGMSLCELGCGSGWMTRFAARQERTDGRLLRRRRRLVHRGAGGVRDGLREQCRARRDEPEQLERGDAGRNDRDRAPRVTGRRGGQGVLHGEHRFRHAPP